MRKISLDFETRSGCNLITEGTYRYATDHSTEILCCSYKVDGGPVKSWFPEWVADATNCHSDRPPWVYGPAIYTAWNSQFDRLIWQYVAEYDHDWPQTNVNQWVCSSALARANGLPAKLENAAIALGTTAQKDKRGKELIKLLSLPSGGPRYNPTFNEDPDLLLEMIDYCDQDVETEHGLLQCLRPFTETELREFHANETINDRGIGIDVSFAEKAVTYGDVERGVLEDRMAHLTSGVIERPSQSQRIKKWLLHGYEEYIDADDLQGNRFHAPDPEACRVPPQVVNAMTVYKKGERKLSFDKAVRERILAAYDEDPSIMYPSVHEVIQITDLANKSSTAKYRKMLEREIEGRVYGAYMFAGAVSTGRFSAQGVQPHNMVRDVVDDFDASLRNLDRQEDTQVIHTLAKMMRPTIIARDGYLHWSDWSNVEGRALPWLANTDSAHEKLELFRYCDAHPDEPDVYERMAERMGLEDRQNGKVAELSLGFGGGQGALQAMARGYGVHIANPKPVVGLWRDANPWAQPFWYALKDAAWAAMTAPNTAHHVGRVSYLRTPNTHNGLGTLWCKLPSGRVLAYVNPKFERVPVPWNDEETMVELTAIKANFSPKAGEKEWPRNKLWYGVLCENITQAVCADLLRDALVRFDEEGLDVVLHTHDEVIIECKDDVRADVQRIMQTPPAWAEGLPLVADIHRGSRYKQSI